MTELIAMTNLYHPSVDGLKKRKRGRVRRSAWLRRSSAQLTAATLANGSRSPP